LRLGVDLGGTKTEAVVLDHEGAVRARRRVPSARTYEASIALLADLVGVLEAEVWARPVRSGSARRARLRPAQASCETPIQPG
jgi:fructokinase